MEGRESSGFKKQYLDETARIRDQVEYNTKLAKSRFSFVIFYLLVHVIIFPLLAFLVNGIINGGEWSGMSLALILGLSIIAVFEIIIWTRTGSEEERINSRTPWAAAILLVSIATFYLMLGLLD